MIRKAFVCCAGALAGVSAGAWSDGYFEQPNPVTNQLNKILVSAGFADADTEPGAGTEPAVASLQPGEIENSLAPVDATASAPTPVASPASVSTSNADLGDRGNANTALPAQPPGVHTENPNRDTSESRTPDIASVESTRLPVQQDATPTAPQREQANETQKASPSDSRAQDTNISESRVTPLKTVKANEGAKQTPDGSLVRERFRKAIFESPTGEQLSYRVLKPASGDAAGPLPLLLFLHGKGERGNDNALQLKHGLEMVASDRGMKQFPAIVIAPQCPPDQLWSSTLEAKSGQPKIEATPTVAMQLTMELLDSIQLTENVDPDRIYVTGLSMGGFGTVDLVARRPRMFAAAAPLCGGGDSSAAVVRRMLDTPFWFIHGDKDTAVDVNRSREMVKALETAGASPRYSELAGYGHNVWDAAYSDSSLFAWMFNQSRSGVIDQKLEQQQIASASSMKTPAVPKASATKTREATEATQARKTVSAEVDVDDESDNGNRLTGNWKVLSATQSGKQTDAAELAMMSVVISPQQIQIRIGERGESTGYRLAELADGSRGAIDIVSDRDGIKDARGIFQVKDDMLLLCWGMPGEDRPSELRNGSGLRTMALQRKK